MHDDLKQWRVTAYCDAGHGVEIPHPLTWIVRATDERDALQVFRSTVAAQVRRLVRATAAPKE